MKLNCWEFRKCGREPNGKKVKELGVCPATGETRLHGVHSGKNAGRACWVVSGTLSGNKSKLSHVGKYSNCVECEFYNQVRKDEGSQFIISPFLLKKLRS